MLSLEDFWVWDSWIADDGDTYHLYFLQAPRSLIDPGHRHTSAQIGHATSQDLKSWQYQGVALGPGHKGSWDDLALWTGSTVRGDDGAWRMFYTAISSRGHGVGEQRIGLAESDDLTNWRRVGDRPVLEADPRWYQTHGTTGDPAASETWRDPFVFRDPDGDGWHMMITARKPGAARLNDGVIGHARSSDLVHWELGPPLTEPAGFGQLEVTQVRLVAGRPILIFSCGIEELSADRRRFGDYCTWSVTGKSLCGPWDISIATPFVAEPDLFAAPLVQDRSGNWALLGFVNLEPKGVNSFDIINPIPVITEQGVLVAAPGYSPVGEALLSAHDRSGDGQSMLTAQNDHSDDQAEPAFGT